MRNILYMFLNGSLLTLKGKSLSRFLKRNLSGEKMKIFNVAEKNDAAKNIAALLSSGTSIKREGLSKFNKIYEFECDVFGQKSKMIMTSVAGHLLDLDFRPSHKKWETTSVISLFDAPVEKICLPDRQDIKKTLQREVKSCSKLIVWTDCDREGENIGFEVIEVCKAVKPNIEVYRAKFSEISNISVKRALRNLERPNKHISDAVEVRRELDLRIGAAFTRFQTLHLRKAFPSALGENLVSYGSCQFPTLGFVVDRFKEISQFIPEPFWEIQVTHTVNDLSVDFVWKRKRLFDKVSCTVLFDKCLEWEVAKVINVNTNPKTKWRPKPLDTVELQKKMSRKLKMNAKETLQIAEKLYTQGLISYPRTETNIFPKELNLVPFVQCQTDDPRWGEFAQKILIAGPNPFNGNKTDNAHPPIHPIKHSSSLRDKEKTVYEYIVRHFLACLSNHAQGLETIVEISIAEEEFTAKGLMITAKNYLEVYPYEKWTDKELPVYSMGDTFKPQISMGEGETSPPELLTEADLISLMEKHGIGTDATHAEHIETIKKRLYVGLQNNKFFVPRTLGMGLVEGYVNMGYTVSKPQLRAELEADLKRVSDNEAAPQDILAKHIQSYKELFKGVQTRVDRLSEAIQNYFQVQAVPVDPNTLTEGETDRVLKCPKCGSNMFLKKTKTNKSLLSCSNYPNCTEALWFPSDVLEATVSNEVCNSCGPDTHLVEFKFKPGSTYLPTNYTGCLGCDVNLLEFLNWNRRSRAKPLAERQNDSGFSSLTESSPEGHQPPEGSSSSTPKCHCGVPAISLRTKKFDVNFGRSFFKCRLRKCNFFRWEDQPERPARIPRETSSAQGDGEVLRCFCAQPCREAVVLKDGPNKGRPFFACATYQKDGGCNFFKWADGGDGENCSRNNSTNQRSRSNTSLRKP